MPSNTPLILEASLQVLSTYASASPTSYRGQTIDSGPAVLATLMAADNGEVSQHALSTWLDQFQQGINSVGVFGGLAGFYAGTHIASTFYPSLASLVNQLRITLAHEIPRGLWRTESVAWKDYDLISGPSGVILALTVNPACRSESVLPAARHLVTLSSSADLDKLRVNAYQNDEQRAWNYGQINTGLAHGVTGVAAALRAASETGVAVAELVCPALERICGWLVDEAFIDDLGLLTWHPASLDKMARPNGASGRQAWCYGTPGVAWTLWEAARVLGDHGLQTYAADAMRSFCAAFDETFHLDQAPVDDALGVCHGAAGTLALLDAFERYAGLQEAAHLRDRLETMLCDRLDEICELGTSNMSLLTGASGILAVLLTVRGGRREWLNQLALR